MMPQEPSTEPEDDEQWRPIPGYEDTYQVSSLGRVFSHPRPRTSGGLLKQRVDDAGYPGVNLVQGGQQKAFRVHVLIALAFLGPRPEDYEVRHLDGSRVSRLDNLAYGTRAENMQDASRHGVLSWRGRLTECKHGHPFDEANTLTSRGRRRCRTCMRFYYENSKASR